MELKINQGIIENGKHYYPVHIFYNHTDAGGIVYYANYLRIAEEARVSLFDVLGSDDKQGYNDIKEIGDFVVRKAEVEYYNSARFGEDLVIESTIEETGKAYVVVKQIIKRGEETLTEVKTKIVFVGVECGNHSAGCPLGGGGVVKNKPQRIPEFWVKRLEKITEK